MSVSLLSVAAASARTPPWLHVYIVGTGSVGARNALAGDRSHLGALTVLLLSQGFTETLHFGIRGTLVECPFLALT